VAPCRCGRLNRRFGGLYRLHLQGRKIRERRTSVSRFNRPHLHGATPKKTAFFIVTAVKTSNPTYLTLNRVNECLPLFSTVSQVPTHKYKMHILQTERRGGMVSNSASYREVPGANVCQENCYPK
jgi:hypothetical protein